MGSDHKIDEFKHSKSICGLTFEFGAVIVNSVNFFDLLHLYFIWTWNPPCNLQWSISWWPKQTQTSCLEYPEIWREDFFTNFYFSQCDLVNSSMIWSMFNWTYLAMILVQLWRLEKISTFWQFLLLHLFHKMNDGSIYLILFSDFSKL